MRITPTVFQFTLLVLSTFTAKSRMAPAAIIKKRSPIPFSPPGRGRGAGNPRLRACASRRFRVSLIEPAGTRASVALAAGGDDLTVLVIDDDPDMRVLVSAVREPGPAIGYQVQEATTGIRGLSAYNRLTLPGGRSAG